MTAFRRAYPARLILRMLAREASEPIGAVQLIRAIIRDEPIKMRKLAKNLGVDAEKLTNMIIYRNSKPPVLMRNFVLREVKELFGLYCRNMVADSFSDDIVVFLDDGISSQWLSTLISLNESLNGKGIAPLCVYAGNLESPAEVRRAYIDVTENLNIHVNTVKYRLRKIFDNLGCRVTDMPEMADFPALRYTIKQFVLSSYAYRVAVAGHQNTIA